MNQQNSEFLVWSEGVCHLSEVAKLLGQQLLSFCSAFGMSHDIETDVERGRLLRIKKAGARAFLECAFDTRDMEVSLALKDPQERLVRVIAYANVDAHVEYRFEKKQSTSLPILESTVQTMKLLIDTSTEEAFFQATALLLETFLSPHTEKIQHA